MFNHCFRKQAIAEILFYEYGAHQRCTNSNIARCIYDLVSHANLILFYVEIAELASATVATVLTDPNVWLSFGIYLLPTWLGQHSKVDLVRGLPSPPFRDKQTRINLKDFTSEKTHTNSVLHGPSVIFKSHLLQFCCVFLHEELIKNWIVRNELARRCYSICARKANNYCVDTM